MEYFSTEEAQQIIKRAKCDKYIFKTTHYNRYVELIYKLENITCITFPQWVHVANIAFKENYYYVTINIFKSEFLYDMKIVLNHRFITVLDKIEYNINNNLKQNEKQDS